MWVEGQRITNAFVSFSWVLWDKNPPPPSRNIFHSWSCMLRQLLFQKQDGKSKTGNVLSWFFAYFCYSLNNAIICIGSFVQTCETLHSRIFDYPESRKNLNNDTTHHHFVKIEKLTSVQLWICFPFSPVQPKRSPSHMVCLITDTTDQ